ncbi:MAG: gamma carbonic anhydrase family protein, partial [Chitinivibrionales bacterium]|nr:gamma carbonic anhydrase family protein [Chitinivibrionales bacterium]
MANVKKRPELIDATAFIAQGAIVVGEVYLEKETSVWFNAVLRGDTESLTIKTGTNIQDGCILHADPGFPLFIEEGVTVGHGAIIHGAHVAKNSLIGIRAVLLNGAVVGKNSIVAAGSLVPEGKVFPEGCLIMGT